MFVSGKKSVKSNKKMSRRYFDTHYHENRYGTTRERDHPRGIQYQDDPLSPINSDDETYLYKSKNPEDHYLNKPLNSKTGKQTEKSTNEDNQSQQQQSRENQYRKEECYSPDSQYHKETKYPSTATTTTLRDGQETNYQRKDANKETKDVQNTDERLARLETMLQEIMKRTITNTNETPTNYNEKESDGVKFALEPRRHDFTTSQWINKIQETAFVNNWNEKTTIQYMETQMSGIIKAWYKNLPNRDFSWPEWKLLITKTFPDNIDFITTLKRLVTRIKSSEESVTNYYFSKMYLIEGCKITGTDAVSCLIDGLNNQQIQDAAKQQNFPTPETLYAEYLSTLPDYVVDYQPPDIVMPPPETNHWYYDDKDNDTKQTFDYVQQKSHNFDGDEAMYSKDEVDQEENQSPPPLLGKKSSGSVHSRLDKNFLHLRQRTRRRPLAMKFCTICKERGHLARHCKTMKRVLFCHNNNHSNFEINCKINGKSINSLIDTGSTIITIQQNLVEELDLKLTPIVETLHGFGGFLTKSLGEVEISLEVDLVKTRIKVTVVPNHFQHVPLIIGQSLFDQKNIVLLCCNNRIKIFDRSTSGMILSYD